MNFDLSEDQHQIKRTARELLASRSTWEKVRTAAEGGRYDDDLFKEVSELGWPGIAISEENGGQGLGMVELAAGLGGAGHPGGGARGARLRVCGDAIPRDRARRARHRACRLVRSAFALAAVAGERRGARRA